MADPNPPHDGAAPFRILSLSGGGVRGIYQAVFLNALSARLSSPLRDKFHLIAGTSTGAILAAALTRDVPLSQMVEFYRNEAPRVFRNRRFLSGFRKGAHYEHDALRRALESAFGESSLRDCRPALLIPATGLDMFSSKVFWRHDDSPSDDDDLDRKLVDVVMASAAAPTYFPPVKPRGSERAYVDGGLWANSPSLISAIYANRFMGVEFSRMRVLSVGNGSHAGGALREEFKELRPYGPRMIGAVLEMMFESQASSADVMAADLVGPSNVMTVNDPIPGGIIRLDDVKRAIAQLPALAERHVARHAGALLDFLGEERRFSSRAASRGRQGSLSDRADAAPLGQRITNLQRLGPRPGGNLGPGKSGGGGIGGSGRGLRGRGGLGGRRR